MDDINGPPASPAWAWSVTKFPHPDSRKGVMYLLPNGRPPRYPDKPIPAAREDRSDESLLTYAEQGPHCIACGRTHDVDNRHDRIVAS